MTDLTIKQLYEKLEELIEMGQGNSEFRVSCDSDSPYVTIPKNVDAILGFDYVLFPDYRDWRPNND